MTAKNKKFPLEARLVDMVEPETTADGDSEMPNLPTSKPSAEWCGSYDHSRQKLAMSSKFSEIMATPDSIPSGLA